MGRCVGGVGITFGSGAPFLGHAAGGGGGLPPSSSGGREWLIVRGPLKNVCKIRVAFQPTAPFGMGDGGGWALGGGGGEGEGRHGSVAFHRQHPPERPWGRRGSAAEKGGGTVDDGGGDREGGSSRGSGTKKDADMIKTPPS